MTKFSPSYFSKNSITCSLFGVISLLTFSPVNMNEFLTTMTFFSDIKGIVKASSITVDMSVSYRLYLT